MQVGISEETDRHIEIKRQRSVRNSAALQVGNKCNECTTAFLYLEGAEGGDFSKTVQKAGEIVHHHSWFLFLKSKPKHSQCS